MRNSLSNMRALLGDVDADFDVDIYDIVKIAGLYGQTLPPVWPIPPPDVDGTAMWTSTM